MKKKRKWLENCEITRYEFHDGSVTTCAKKFVDNLWMCEIGWDFGEKYQKNWLPKEEIFMKKDTFNKIKLHEITELYKSLKKIKYKKPEIKKLISALLVINHDIKKDIFVEQILKFD